MGKLRIPANTTKAIFDKELKTLQRHLDQMNRQHNRLIYSYKEIKMNTKACKQFEELDRLSLNQLALFRAHIRWIQINIDNAQRTHARMMGAATDFMKHTKGYQKGLDRQLAIYSKAVKVLDLQYRERERSA